MNAMFSCENCNVWPENVIRQFAIFSISKNLTFSNHFIQVRVAEYPGAYPGNTGPELGKSQDGTPVQCRAL